MQVNIFQSYLVMFNFLDKCYDDTKNDTLGALLGAFNPTLSDDNLPMDLAAWEDWSQCFQRFANEDKIDEKKIFNITMDFIYFYKNEFDFDLDWLLNEMKNGEQENNWIYAVEKVIHQ